MALLLILGCVGDAQPMRSVSGDATKLTFIDGKGTHTLLMSTIPSTQKTVAQVESYINTWITNNVVDYQAKAHVFTVSPLSFATGTWNLGSVIPANWWVSP